MGFIVNQAINRIDVNGLYSPRCECRKLRLIANAWSRVLRLKARTRFGRGLLHCITRIRCKRRCSGSRGGTYNYLTGVITLCENNSSGPRTPPELMGTLKHELAHAASRCRNPPLTCGQCMREEKQAYYRAGQCWDDRSCTIRAWGSCRSKIYCWRPYPRNPYIYLNRRRPRWYVRIPRTPNPPIPSTITWP